MRYLKSSKLNDVREPDEEVDEDYVQRYVGKDTLEWFRNLGGTEELWRRQGRVYVKSTSPDGAEVRETVFTPLPCDHCKSRPPAGHTCPNCGRKG